MFFRRIMSIIVCLAFILTSLTPSAYAQTVFNLPQPGTMVDLSGAFAPAVLKGVTIHPADPLLFDFIVDNGQSGLQGQALTDETTKLVKYFLAGLAVPEKDLWVNLSPKENERVMADDLSRTDVGSAMLAQDYILKQVTASLMYPEKDLGRRFWDEIYKRAYAQFGNTNMPVDTFNKVWIMPAEATVYQNGNDAFVGRAQLKVMLESDFEAAKGVVSRQAAADIELAKGVVRSVILPVLEKEVNEGRNFAPLRQVFHSMILAGWYKNALKESLLARVYANTNKVSGIEIPEKDAREKVYAQYMEAYQKGVYNYVKEELDRNTNEAVPHKYFSGGITELSVDPGKADVSQVDFKGASTKQSYRLDVSTDGAQELSRADQKVLDGAKTIIESLLTESYQNGDITDTVYKNALANTYKNLVEWTQDPDIYRIDPSIRAANLAAIRDGRWDDIIEAYRQDILFGTAGIRGKAVLSEKELQTFKAEGPLGNFLKGPNTINTFKLLKTTQGLIKMARETGLKRVVIGYDSRIGGAAFADMIARLFIAQSTPEHEFKIFLFDEASPFPELSYGITTDVVKGDIGLLISASHNPADYNGYKITLGNGAQLNQASKNQVTAAIDQVRNSDIVMAASLADAKPGQLVWLGGSEALEGKDYYGFERIDMHSLHVEQVKKFILNKEVVVAHSGDLKFGFAAFNGAGFKAVPRLLRETGFTNVKVIEKLQKLDGSFPAWKFGEQPDPGDPISADIAVKEFIAEYGQQVFDLLDALFGTDPDADRMGLSVKVPESQQKYFGKYRLLSANDVWTLLIWYRLSMKKQMGLLENPSNHAVAFSHVTTDAIEAVAKMFGVDAIGKMLDVTGTLEKGDYLAGRRTWVGFTYLADILEDAYQMGKFVEMLAEESNGVSVQGHTKEKDGTLAVILVAEVAAYARSQGKTLFELLDDVYALIGHYATANKPLPRVGSFEKAAGVSEKIKIIKRSQEWGTKANEDAHTDHPFMIAGKKVLGAVEFASGRIDKTHYAGVPDEGVRFFFEDEQLQPGDPFTNSHNYITIRASGTSQALRFYTQIFSRDVSPEQKAKNYAEAERVALEAQRQILEEVNLEKHLPPVRAQLESIYAQNEPVADKAQDLGGIDLGQGNYLKVIATGTAGVPQFDPAQLKQLQKDLRGVIPVPVGVPVPVSVRPLLGLDPNSGNENLQLSQMGPLTFEVEQDA